MFIQIESLDRSPAIGAGQPGPALGDMHRIRTANRPGGLRTAHPEAHHRIDLVAHPSDDLLGEILGGEDQVDAKLPPAPAQLGHLVGEERFSVRPKWSPRC